MSPIRVDFTDVADAGEFPLKQPGDYTGKISAVTQKTGQTSGKNYLEVQVDLDDGGKAWSNYSLQPQALWRLKQLLQRVGHDPMALEGAFELDPDEDLLGRDVVARLTVENYNGTDRNKVIDLLEPTAVAAGANW